MRLLIISLITWYLHTTLAKVICHQPPPQPDQIPRFQDCQELIEDIFAISKLEDDEKVLWSPHDSDRPGSRKLPYIFTSPSVNNNCEVLVDAVKPDAEDIFCVHDIGVKAQGISSVCLNEESRSEPTIGADSVGPKRSIAVILVKKIPLPESVGELFNSTARSIPTLRLLFQLAGTREAFHEVSTS